MFLSVFICLFFGVHIYSKGNGQIFMNFYVRVRPDQKQEVIKLRERWGSYPRYKNITQIFKVPIINVFFSMILALCLTLLQKYPWIMKLVDGFCAVALKSPLNHKRQIKCYKNPDRIRINRRSTWKWVRVLHFKPPLIWGLTWGKRKSKLWMKLSFYSILNVNHGQ